MLSGRSAFLLVAVEDRARRSPLMLFDERTNLVAFKFIRSSFPCLVRQWGEGGRRRYSIRRRAINQRVGRGRRLWELGAWIKDLFTTTLLGDRRSSTDSPRHRFEFSSLGKV